MTGVNTLPETNSSRLKMMVSNRNLLFQGSIFRGYVSFRECKSHWFFSIHGPRDVKVGHPPDDTILRSIVDTRGRGLIKKHHKGSMKHFSLCLEAEHLQRTELICQSWSVTCLHKRLELVQQISSTAAVLINYIPFAKISKATLYLLQTCAATTCDP